MEDDGARGEEGNDPGLDAAHGTCEDGCGGRTAVPLTMHKAHMGATPEFGTLDVKEFTVGAMLRAGLAVRRIVKEAATMEDAATLIVRYLYDQCVDPATGERTCALVRFYKTHRFGDLEPALKAFAERLLDGTAHEDSMRCLVLLGTAGDEEAWNTRRGSRAHQAIPLPSTEFVRKAPMIAKLIEDIGLEIDDVVSGVGSRRESGSRNYDVFHVETAAGSPYIPAQREFVERHGIASVVGFGGLLRSGELYAVVLFSRAQIAPPSAGRFRAIALDVRSALFMLDEGQTWSDEVA